MPQETDEQWIERKSRARGAAGTFPSPRARVDPRRPPEDPDSEEAWLGRKHRERTGELRLALQDGFSIEPASAKEIISLSRQTGLHPDLVAEDPFEIANALRDKEFDLETFQKGQLVTSLLKRNKYFAAVAREDIQKLPNYENFIKRPRALWPLSEKRIDEMAGRMAEKRLAQMAEMANFARVPLLGGQTTEESLNAFRESLGPDTFKGWVAEAKAELLSEEEFINGNEKVGGLETIKRRFQENPLFAVPFTASIPDIIQVKQLYDAGKAFESEQGPTDEQMDTLIRWGRKAMAAEERGVDWWGKTAGVLVELSSFMGEFGLTSGVAPVVKAGLKKAGTGLAESFLKRAVTRALGNRVTGFFVSSAAQTAFRAPLRITVDTVDQMIQEFQLIESEKGELTAIFTAEGDGFFGSFVKAVGREFVEGVSERSGFLLEKFTGPVKIALARRWFRINPGKGIPGFISKLKEKTGWNGVIAEVFEERVGEVMRFGLRIDEVYHPPTIEHLSVELAAFTVPAAGFAALGALGGRRSHIRRSDPEYLKEFGRQAKDIKAWESDPESMEKLTRDAAKGTDRETLSIDRRDWDTHWFDQKDESGRPMDGREAYKQVTGDYKGYDQAVAEKVELEVPFEKYARHLARSTHNDALAEHFKLDPLEVTDKQAQEIDPQPVRGQPPAAPPVSGVQEPAEGEVGVPAEPTLDGPKAEAEEIRGVISEALGRIGVPKGQIEPQAKLFEAIFGTLPARAGVSPLEAFRGFNLELQRPEVEALLKEEEEAAGRTLEQPPEPGVPEEEIYEPPVLPALGDQAAIDRATEEAQIRGFSAVRVSGAEGAFPGTIVFEQPERLAGEEEDEPRGRIRFDIDQLNRLRTTIQLLRKANLSTFLHESGHLFLELFGQMALRDTATEDLKTDFQSLLDWMEIKDGATWAAMPLDTRKAQHEKFARGFELYLREGKAPTPELRSMFRRFWGWLRRIYRSIKNMPYFAGVQLTDEVRAVMDRMLATQEEIDAARREQQAVPLYRDLKAAGLSDQEAKEYTDLLNEAEESGQEEAIRSTLEDVFKRQGPALQEARKTIQGEIEREVNKMPIYIALANLQKGTQPDGSPLPEGMKPIKLSKKLIAEEFSAATLKALPRKTWTTLETGVSPQDAAEIFKYTGSEEFIKALTEAEKKDSLIRRKTSERMEEVFREIETASRLEKEARAALHTEHRGKVLRFELEHLMKFHLPKFKGLAKKFLGKRLPSEKLYRDKAEKEIRAKPIHKIRPSLYQAAMRRDAGEAAKQFMKGDIPAAIQTKLDELMNYERFRAAEHELEEVDHGVEYSRRLMKKGPRQRIGKAGNDYLEQLEDFLDRFELRPVSARRIKKRQQLRQWLADEAADTGYEAPVWTAALEEAFEVNYRELTPEDFESLIDSLKAIDHLATLKTTLILEKERRDLQEVADEVAGSVLENATIRPSDPGRSEVMDKLRKHGRQALAPLINIDTLTRDLDGRQDLGPVNTHLKGVIDDASVEKLFPMREKSGEDLAALYDQFYTSADLRKMAKERIWIERIQGSLTKEEILCVWLNRGNEGNEKALLDAKKFHSRVRKERMTVEDLDAITGVLEKKDLDFGQALWNYLGTYKDEIQKAYRRRTGLPMREVEARPITTKYGIYAGGYYPLQYSAEDSTTVAEESIEEIVKSIRAGRFSRAQTKRDFTIARIGSGGRPVFLDLSVSHRHINRVIYDLALGDAVNYVVRVLHHKTVRNAFEAAGKVEDWNTLDVWIQDTAAGEMVSSGFWSRAFRWIRAGHSVSNMAWSVSVFSIQGLGLIQTTVALGPKWVLKGIERIFSRKWIGNGNVWQQASDLSALIRTRDVTWNKDVMDTLKAMKGGIIPVWAQKTFFVHIAKFQRLVDIISWYGAYAKGLDKFGDERKAIRLADQIVRRSQASAIFSDRSAIERGTWSRDVRQQEAVRIWTTFMSYMLVKGNIAYERTRDTNFKNPLQVLKYSMDMALLFSVETLIVALMRGAWPDDEDDDVWSTIGFIAEETGRTVLGTIPLVREFASEMEGFQGGGAFGSVAERAGNAYEQIKQWELDAALIKNVNSLGGTTFHYPSSQMNRFIDAVWRDHAGEDVSPMEYLLYRKRD